MKEKRLQSQKLRARWPPESLVTQETEFLKLANWELDSSALPSFHYGRLNVGGLSDEMALSSSPLLSFYWRFFVLPFFWLDPQEKSQEDGWERKIWIDSLISILWPREGKRG